MSKIQVGWTPAPTIDATKLLAPVASSETERPSHVCVGFTKVGPHSFSEWLEQELVEAGATFVSYDGERSGFAVIPAAAENIAASIIISRGELDENAPCSL